MKRLGKVARRSSFVDGYVYGAYVEEVTVVQRQTPREPRAKVALLYDKPEPTLEREIIHAPGSTAAPLLPDRDRNQVTHRDAIFNRARGRDSRSHLSLRA